MRYIIFFVIFFIYNISLSQNKLDLSGLGIKEIPNYVFDSVHISHLLLGPKKLTCYLPLTCIPESPNNISEISNKIIKMKELVYLDLSANQVEFLPNKIVENNKLDTLILNFNTKFNIDKNMNILYKLCKSLNYLSIIGVPITEEQKKVIWSINPKMTLRTEF